MLIVNREKAKVLWKRAIHGPRRRNVRTEPAFSIQLPTVVVVRGTE